MSLISTVDKLGFSVLRLNFVIDEKKTQQKQYCFFNNNIATYYSTDKTAYTDMAA